MIFHVGIENNNDARSIAWALAQRRKIQQVLTER